MSTVADASTKTSLKNIVQSVRRFSSARERPSMRRKSVPLMRNTISGSRLLNKSSLTIKITNRSIISGNCEVNSSDRPYWRPEVAKKLSKRLRKKMIEYNVLTVLRNSPQRHQPVIFHSVRRNRKTSNTNQATKPPSLARPCSLEILHL